MPISGERAAAERLADEEKRLRWFQDAIATGIDPGAVVDTINEAHAQWVAAQAELHGTPAPDCEDRCRGQRDDRLVGDVGALKDGKPESWARLYRKLRLN